METFPGLMAGLLSAQEDASFLWILPASSPRPQNWKLNHTLLVLLPCGNLVSPLVDKTCGGQQVSWCEKTLELKFLLFHRKILPNRGLTIGYLVRRPSKSSNERLLPGNLSKSKRTTSPSLESAENLSSLLNPTHLLLRWNKKRNGQSH